MECDTTKFKKRQIGKITNRVIRLLNLEIEEDAPIFINDNNLELIAIKHPYDFAKYGNDLEKIINNPTYISQHPINKSIEYIKVYKQEQDYVLVAVRVSLSRNYYIRTLFVMSDEKVRKYWLKGAFKTY
ncbi:MAG: PBECR3 domain-containing polyvalent protein [Candidatus Humimicrobiaceae bacterium]